MTRIKGAQPAHHRPGRQRAPCAEGDRQQTDILVAQGYDAGGHNRPIGTFTLVPQIGSGNRGAGCHRGRRHRYRGTGGCPRWHFGAQGCSWLGTLWLGTREHGCRRRWRRS